MEHFLDNVCLQERLFNSLSNDRYIFGIILSYDSLPQGIILSSRRISLP
jgi:hypothetical protein